MPKIQSIGRGRRKSNPSLAAPHRRTDQCRRARWDADKAPCAARRRARSLAYSCPAPQPGGRPSTRAAARTRRPAWHLRRPSGRSTPGRSRCSLGSSAPRLAAPPIERTAGLPGRALPRPDRRRSGRIWGPVGSGEGEG
jgi:hypothetical protein